MTIRYFLDTSFSIATAIESDEFHSKAHLLSAKLQSEDSKILTTQAVLIEIGNSFSGRAYRSYAVDFFDKVGSEPNFEIVSLSDALIDAGVDLFRSRMDKNWSLVDCISFVVMKDLKVELALTNDHHFVQAGFRALLRED